MNARIATVVAVLFVTAAAFAADAPPQMSPQQKTTMERMTRAATPGAQHAMLARMAGEWTCAVRMQMDPSQPAQKSQSTATITALMDGRYIQEVDSGQMNGMPFNGMGLYGFDNVTGRYVSSWIDNMGTGIMTSVGTPDASGKVITWTASMNDPATGKPAKARMVTTITDDDHHTLEMFGVAPGTKKEMKMMTIEYARKQ